MRACPFVWLCPPLLFFFYFAAETSGFIVQARGGGGVEGGAGNSRGAVNVVQARMRGLGDGPRTIVAKAGHVRGLLLDVSVELICAQYSPKYVRFTGILFLVGTKGLATNSCWWWNCAD